MKLNKTLVLPTAALLLVVGTGAVLATSSPRADSGGAAVVPAAESPSPSPSQGAKREFKDTALSDVLDSLVTKGTITAAQKQAILDALTAERESRIAEAKKAAEARRAAAQQLKDFLSDGEITQDELDKLPADSPIRQLTNLMDDGKITTDELRSLGRGLFGGFGNGRGHAFGHGFFGPKVAPDASPAPSTGTSG